jgi:hypothetical protein
VHARVGLAHGAFHFGVAVVADHDDLAALLAHLGHFHVHLGDQRAGGVEDAQAARIRLGAHRLGHAVGREHQRIAGRHFAQVLDEDRALGAGR